MSRSAGRDRVMLELKRSIGPAALFLVLIVAGIAAAVIVVRNLAGDKPWVSYVAYRAEFDNVEGVVPGRHELRIAGVKAGSIKESKLENGRPILVLNVEKKYAPLHTNAKAVIRPVTALEDMYVDLTSRGTKDAPELKPDQVLPASRTKSTVEVGRVLNILEEDTRERFATILDQLSAGTDDRGRKLREGFAQLGPFLETATKLGDALNDRRTNTARLVHNFGNISGVLAKRDRQLAGFVDEGGRLLGTLAAHDTSLSSTIGQLPGTFRNLQATLANVRGTTTSVDAALKALRPVAKQLPAGLDSLSAFSDDATPAVKSLRPSVKALRPLAAELPKTSANASDALTPLVPQASQLVKGAKTVSPCLPLFGTFLSRIQSVLKYNDVGFVPQARSNVQLDFTSVGNVIKDPNWKVHQPCFMDYEAAIKANGQGTTRLPSRDDAVSQEQNR